MKIYKDMLLLLILSLVLIGGINDINRAKKEESIYISTSKGNFKFKNDKEFIEFMEGWSR